MEKLLAFGGMVMAILAQVGNMIVNKAAMSKGINKYTMVVYANAVSTLLLLPYALFIFHRSSPDRPPPLTFSILSRFFLLAFLACSGQIFGYIGVDYSSPTLGTAMLNLIPAFTFILVLIFRMENVYWRRLRGFYHSQAKVLGTIVSITGAFVVTLYKGPPIILLSAPDEFLSSPPQHSNWILGGLFLAADSFTSSLWYILQGSILQKYPAVVFVVFFQCFFATIQSAVFTIQSRCKCLGVETRYGADFYIIHWNCFNCYPIQFDQLVRVEGWSSLLLYVQASWDHFWCDHGCHVFGRSILSWKFGWCSYNCHWILWSDVGKSRRREASWWKMVAGKVNH
ncbi:WAT1-related protein [Rosa sericea]